MLRKPPFGLPHEEPRLLISGVVGRIWTLRRDQPHLSEPEAFRAWVAGGTARVLFGLRVDSEGVRLTPLG
jgi:hypothetical protein